MTDGSRWFSFRARGALALAASALLWAIVSWPLPRHLASGVPASAHRAPADVTRMIPGDHLQFMYYCWLAGDMAAGRTPWFYNLYEFHTGDDRERFEPDTYYLPFSLLFAAGAALGGRALGWNLAGFVSLWITLLFTWCLTRRWARGEWPAFLAALLGLALPVRWINLFGGSPAGFAMAWIPALLLGLDLAAREGRPAGGALAGLAILFAAWGDLHVFFFGALAAPGWVVLALAARGPAGGRPLAALGGVARALVPAAIGLGLALAMPLFRSLVFRLIMGALPAAHAVGPRTLREALIYSPHWRGFVGVVAPGVSDTIYLGAGLLALLAAGWLALLVAAWRQTRAPASGAPAESALTPRRAWVALTLLGAGLALVMLLALGARGPRDAAAFKAVRALIPPYALVRQPAKIFCLMPTLAAVAAALALSGLAAWRSRAWLAGLGGLCLVLLPADYARRVRPTISVLEPAQQAYAAVAADAAAAGRAPHALVLTLWPGDSHYASIYQYFASLYRVRMVNGYNPFIKEGYFENIFRRFESANQGDLSDEQLEALGRMGVGYVMLHENLFPEKVSPFPVTQTLRRLLEHPRLSLLRQDGSVWAFAIRPAGAPPRETAPGRASAWTLGFPARRYELERTWAEGPVRAKACDEAGGGACVELAGPGARLATEPQGVAAETNLCWLVRVRGTGSFAFASTVTESRRAAVDSPDWPIRIVESNVSRHASTASEHIRVAGEAAVQSGEWSWHSLPAGGHRAFALRRLCLERRDGALELDIALLVGGPWAPPRRGETRSLPAALFFHAGHIELDTGAVVFRPDADAKGIVFYGPKLPLEPGAYELNLAFESPAPPGTRLGVLKLDRQAPGGPDAGADVAAGQPAQLRWRQPDSLPFNLVVVYDGTGELRLNRVDLIRLDEPAGSPAASAHTTHAALYPAPAVR